MGGLRSALIVVLASVLCSCGGASSSPTLLPVATAAPVNQAGGNPKPVASPGVTIREISTPAGLGPLLGGIAQGRFGLDLGRRLLEYTRYGWRALRKRAVHDAYRRRSHIRWTANRTRRGNKHQRCVLCVPCVRAHRFLAAHRHLICRA